MKVKEFLKIPYLCKYETDANCPIETTAANITKAKWVSRYCCRRCYNARKIITRKSKKEIDGLYN